MTETINLKALERRAYRSTFQDGLWDLYLAALMAAFAIIESISEVNDATWVMMLSYIVFLGGAFALFMLGKRYITVPRLGSVQFGHARKVRRIWLAVILGISVLFNVYLVLLTSGTLTAPQWLQDLQASLISQGIMDVVVKAFIGSFVTTVLGVTVFFLEFYRGLYIAVLYGLGIFLTMSFGQPLIMLGLALLVAIPGTILLVRFIQQYPANRGQVQHGSPAAQ